MYSSQAPREYIGTTAYAQLTQLTSLTRCAREPTRRSQAQLSTQVFAPAVFMYPDTFHPQYLLPSLKSDSRRFSLIAKPREKLVISRLKERK